MAPCHDRSGVKKMSLEDVFTTNLSAATRQMIEARVEKIIQCVIDGNSSVPVNKRERTGITEDVGLKPHLQMALYSVRCKLVTEGLTEQEAKIAVTFIMIRDYTLQRMKEATEGGKKIPKRYLDYIAVVAIA
jgi:hypothetical protein